MTTWTADELDRIGNATELRVASLRKDGSLRRCIIWVVRVGDDLYIRSAYGTDNPWYRRAKTSGKGRIKAGGIERDVTFTEPTTPDVHESIDTAYHTKYDRYGKAIVATVVGPKAAQTTLRLLPRD